MLRVEPDYFMERVNQHKLLRHTTDWMKVAAYLPCHAFSIVLFGSSTWCDITVMF